MESDVNEFNNNIIINSGGSIPFVSINSAYDSTVKANGNYINNRTSAVGYLLSIGNETTGGNDNRIITAEAIGNYLFSDNQGTSHGILCGFTKNHTIKHNNINGTYLGIVVKGGDNTDNTVMYNVVKNASIGFWLKSTSYVKILGNTIKDSTENFRCSRNDASVVDNTELIVKNNFFQGGNITIENTTGVFDYNIYKSGITINGDTVTAFKALGNETHGLEETITFNSNDTPSVPSSVAESLDAAYDDGLDASTNWGNDSRLPVVVTKQQGAAWDCGAYVH
jgi:parallel beta-helix repeat protein